MTFFFFFFVFFFSISTKEAKQKEKIVGRSWQMVGRICVLLLYPAGG